MCPCYALQHAFPQLICFRGCSNPFLYCRLDLFVSPYIVACIEVAAMTLCHAFSLAGSPWFNHLGCCCSGLLSCRSLLLGLLLPGNLRLSVLGNVKLSVTWVVADTIACQSLLAPSCLQIGLQPTPLLVKAWCPVPGVELGLLLARFRRQGTSQSSRTLILPQSGSQLGLVHSVVCV